MTCVDCGRPMRPSTALLADNPDTVPHHSRGRCKRCHDARPTATVAAESAPFAYPGEWAESALCAQVDPDMFFPEKWENAANAKKVCGACDVTAECLAYALANGERHGIWGGLNERDRRRLARRVA